MRDQQCGKVEEGFQCAGQRDAATREKLSSGRLLVRDTAGVSRLRLRVKGTATPLEDGVHCHRIDDVAALHDEPLQRNERWNTFGEQPLNASGKGLLVLGEP
jgi:hypothetical protein